MDSKNSNTEVTKQEEKTFEQKIDLLLRKIEIIEKELLRIGENFRPISKLSRSKLCGIRLRIRSLCAPASRRHYN